MVLSAWFGLLAIFPLAVHGAVTILNFDTVSLPGPGSQIGITSHSEAGFVLTPQRTGSRFRLASSGSALNPDNGSNYLQLLQGDSMAVSRLDGLPFTVLEAQLAEYSTLLPGPHQVTFTALTSGGSTVSVLFTLDGLIDGAGGAADFETVMFPSEFNGVVRLWADASVFSLDSMVLQVVPEPQVPLLAAAGLWALGHRRRRRSP